MNDDRICFLASKYINDEGKECIGFSNSINEFTEHIMLEWDKFKDSTLVQELPPEVLIKNSHVKELIDTLGMVDHVGLHEPYDKIVREALKKWEGK